MENNENYTQERKSVDMGKITNWFFNACDQSRYLKLNIWHMFVCVCVYVQQNLKINTIEEII